MVTFIPGVENGDSTELQIFQRDSNGRRNFRGISSPEDVVINMQAGALYILIARQDLHIVLAEK